MEVVGDYPLRSVKVVRALLLEMLDVLSAQRESIVLIGGWVPSLFPLAAREPHLGSLDIDLAIDPEGMSPVNIAMLHSQLNGLGYTPTDQQFTLRRGVEVDGLSLVVQVDLLTADSPVKPDHLEKPDPRNLVQPIRGLDLAFLSPVEQSISGELPDGSSRTIVVKLPGIWPYLLMKSQALHNRYKRKDAYDLYYCIRHFPGHEEGLLHAFNLPEDSPSVRDGLEKMAFDFESVREFGPRAVADFLGIEDEEERELLIRDVFERVRYLLDHLRERNS